jgi:transcriptional regulator of acetoin/glycerol metabolism
LEVSRSTASCRNLECLLHDLGAVLRTFAPFDRVALVLHDPERDVMRLHTLAALHAPAVTESELPIEESPAGIAWRTQEPVVLPDLTLQVPVAEFRRPAPSPAPSGTMEAAEREAILRTLRETNGVLGGARGAAARLGMKRTTLQSRMRKLGIPSGRPSL